MSPNRLKHRQVNAKSRAIRNELAQLNARDGRTPRDVSIDDVCWMARRGELLPPSPSSLDQKELSSWLYGPAMKTVQLERIEVIELDEDGRVIWSAT